MSRRIIVTGGAGFLGSHVCRRLAERGDEPLSLDLRATQVGWTSIEGSVTDAALWQGLPEADGVVHAAAVTDLWQRDEATYTRVNVEGTRLALQYAERVGARFVQVSSYTASLARTIRRENVVTADTIVDPDALVGAYAASKRRAELLCVKAHDAVIVRITAPIGPGDDTPTPPMRLVRDVAAGSLPGMMRGRINLVDVRDVADGIVAALDRAGAGEVYLLSGYDLSLKAFARKVAAAAGVSPPALEVLPLVAAMAARGDELIARATGKSPKAPLAGVRLAALPVRFDASKAKDKLSFTPRPLDETIADAVHYVRGEPSAA